MRTFEDIPAVREQTPLLVGLVGPSATGKTYSALRLATGIQRVSGGDVFMIDTEARRGLHYAEKFKYRHVSFGAPFSPLDYLGAIEHCLKKGAKTIIVDSMSHEHESVGGVLEMHAAEVLRMSRGDAAKAERVKMLAWQKPKAERRRLINTVLQMPCNFIFCFRAKQKLKLVRGGEPEQLGYMPIAGDEFVYEMTLKCLLLPGANGVPVLQSDHEGERAMIKVPEQFRALFSQPKQLSEDIGEQLARWAAGAAAPEAVPVDDLLRRYDACSDPATLRALEDVRRAQWSRTGKDDKARLKVAADDAQARVERASRFSDSDDMGAEPGANDAP